MCDYDRHYCKSCRRDYSCIRHNAMCPTLNKYEDANICGYCLGDRFIEEHVFNNTIEDEFFEDEEFDDKEKD